MIRVYEQCDFLDLSQVLDYLDLSGLNVKESLLVQLINQRKIPCYVDLSGKSGLLDAVDGATGTERVIGAGMQLLYSAFLEKMPTKSGYFFKGVFEGSVQLDGATYESAVRCWIPDLTEDVDYLTDTSSDWMFDAGDLVDSVPVVTVNTKSIFYFNSFHMRPSDVKAFLNLPTPVCSVVSAGDETPANSALLMIAHLRDLLRESYEREKIDLKRINQVALAYGLDEKYGVSKSSSEKLFMHVNNAVKDKMKG